MVLPELHLFEGAVNHIIENLEKKWSSDEMYELYDSLHIVKTGQHGGKFNGKPCKKIVTGFEPVS